MTNFGLWGIATLLLVIGLLLLSILTRIDTDRPVSDVIIIVSIAMMMIGYAKTAIAAFHERDYG